MSFWERWLGGRDRDNIAARPEESRAENVEEVLAEEKEREMAAWKRRLHEKGLLTDDGKYVEVWMFFGDNASDIGEYVSVLREWSIEQKHSQTARTESLRYRVLMVEREFTTFNEVAKFRLDVGDRLVAAHAPPGRSLVYHGSLDTRDIYEDWEVLSIESDSRPAEIPPGVLREVDAEAGPSWRRYAQQSWTDAVERSQA